MGVTTNLLVNEIHPPEGVYISKTSLLDEFQLCEAIAVDSRQNHPWWKLFTGSGFPTWFPMSQTCVLGGFRQSETRPVNNSQLPSFFMTYHRP